MWATAIFEVGLSDQFWIILSRSAMDFQFSFGVEALVLEKKNIDIKGEIF